MFWAREYRTVKGVTTRIDAEEFKEALSFAHEVNSVMFVDLDGVIFIAPYAEPFKTLILH